MKLAFAGNKKGKERLKSCTLFINATRGVFTFSASPSIWKTTQGTLSPQTRISYRQTPYSTLPNPQNFHLPHFHPSQTPLPKPSITPLFHRPIYLNSNFHLFHPSSQPPKILTFPKYTHYFPESLFLPSRTFPLSRQHFSKSIHSHFYYLKLHT